MIDKERDFVLKHSSNIQLSLFKVRYFILKSLLWKTKTNTVFQNYSHIDQFSKLFVISCFVIWHLFVNYSKKQNLWLKSGSSFYNLQSSCYFNNLYLFKMLNYFFQRVTGKIVGSFEIKEGEEIEILEKITKPFTNLIIQVDKNVSWQTFISS